MKNIVIIGGGISGLSAGIHALKSGYQATIIEKNPTSGGLCTTWKRNGNYIDGCIHWITGNRDSSMNEIYKTIGLNELELIKLPYFFKYQEGDKEIVIERDENKFKANLLKYSQGDEAMIDDFMHLVSTLYLTPLSPSTPLQIASKKELLEYLKAVRVTKEEYKYSTSISLNEYAQKFNSPILRNFFVSLIPGNYSLSYFAGVISFFVHENADIYNISSFDFAKRIENIYTELGGKIIFNDEVVSLNTDENKVSSLHTKKGLDISGDYFVNAADYYHFQKHILTSEYQNQERIKIFEDTQNYPLISCLYVSFSVDKDYPLPLEHYFALHLDQGFKCMTSINSSLSFRGYNYLTNDDSSHTLCALIDQSLEDYPLWEKAKQDGTYNQLKNDYAQKVLEMLLSYYPQMKGHIKIIDVASPLTFNRYTNTYRGSYLSHLTTGKSIREVFPIKDEKLSNLYYASQWVNLIGGLPCALANGKLAIQYIAHDDLNN